MYIDFESELGTSTLPKSIYELVWHSWCSLSLFFSRSTTLLRCCPTFLCLLKPTADHQEASITPSSSSSSTSSTWASGIDSAMDPLWFYGNMQREDAETLLSSCAVNVFLVRNSSLAVSNRSPIQQNIIERRSTFPLCFNISKNKYPIQYISLSPPLGKLCYYVVQSRKTVFHSFAHSSGLHGW